MSSAVEAEVVARVRRYRQAARMAVEADAPMKTRCLALLDLADAARREPDLLVRRWAEIAIWSESKYFLGVEDEARDFPPDEYERVQRKLRADGYATCPTCRSLLASDRDFARWRRMRAAHIEELRIREEAVGR